MNKENGLPERMLVTIHAALREYIDPGDSTNESIVPVAAGKRNQNFAKQDDVIELRNAVKVGLNVG
jgi:hypothetical protein